MAKIENTNLLLAAKVTNSLGVSLIRVLLCFLPTNQVNQSALQFQHCRIRGKGGGANSKLGARLNVSVLGRACFCQRVLAIINHIKEHQRRNPISVLVLAAVAFCCQFCCCTLMRLRNKENFGAPHIGWCDVLAIFTDLIQVEVDVDDVDNNLNRWKIMSVLPQVSTLKSVTINSTNCLTKHHKLYFSNTPCHFQDPETFMFNCQS